MKIKSLYILLSSFAIGFLIVVMGYLYFDGRKSLLKEDIQYKSQVEDNLAFLEFVSHIKRISDIDSQNREALDASFSQIQKEIDEFSFGLFHFRKDDRLRLKELLNQLHSTLNQKREYQVQVENIEAKTKLYWGKIEALLQDKIQQQIRNGKDFLPGVKKTLSDWGKDVPLFEKIKRSIDVSYVDKDKFGQLQELIFFSQDLFEMKSRISLSRSNLDNEFKTISEKVLSLNSEATFQNKMLENIRAYFKELRSHYEMLLEVQEVEQKILSIKENLNTWLQDSLMDKWHRFNLDLYQENVKEATKRYDIVLKSSAIVSIVIIVILMILFLKIFPYLDKLERNAHTISSGDFGKRFSSIPNNEIGKVMNAFNIMAQEVEDYILRLKKEEKNKVELVEAIQKMKRLNEMGELSSKIAHEIKNPLSILNFCLQDAYEAIQKANLEESEKEIKKAFNAIQRLLALVAKLGSRNQKLEYEDLSIREMITELVSMYRGVVERKNIELVTKTPLVEATIWGSKIEILSALTNLIDNSVEYLQSTPTQEKKIEIFSEVKNQEVLISIRNQGEKIENSDLLFTSFYSSKVGDNRGLGLTIVKDIVIQMKGNIFYHYENGYNIFTLSLPLKS